MSARCNRDPSVVAERLGHLHDPHMAPLTAFVERLRVQRGGGQSVPWFDPSDAGVAAKVLLLFEAPGPLAVGSDSPRPHAKGSGIISCHNNDGSAATVHDLRLLAGLADENGSALCLHWNIVPWYVGDGSKIRPVSDDDLIEAQAALRALLRLLPDLKVVVLAGQAAQRGWARLVLRDTPGLPTVPCLHTSPRVTNTQPEAKDRILRALTLARLLAEA